MIGRRHVAAVLVALTSTTFGAAGCSGGDAWLELKRERPRLSETIDSARIDTAFAHAAELPRLRSLIVQWKGELVREEYFNGATPAARANIKSASKSIISALVGIAIARGHIKSVDQPIGELLPAETRGLDPQKRAITVRDLLSMRAGLRSTSFGNYGAWVTSRNWVAAALHQPLEADPGGRMIYSTGNTHLVSAILTRTTRMSTYRFARQHLAEPLGIQLRPWQTDPQGIYFGGNDMYVTPRAMLKFGTLYLNGGAHEGIQIVPRAWVDSSLVPRTSSPFNANGYGYGWWTRRVRGYDVHYAWGYGGQFIFIAPELEMVVVATSDAEAQREGAHNRALHALLAEKIVPAVLKIDSRFF